MSNALVKPDTKTLVVGASGYDPFAQAANDADDGDDETLDFALRKFAESLRDSRGEDSLTRLSFALEEFDTAISDAEIG